MSADLHIHAFKDNDLTDEDFKCFFAHNLGSKWFNLDGGCKNLDCEHDERICNTDNIWIGEVSWLKAALFDDDKYIPDTVARVNEIIGENLPICDEILIENIMTSFYLPNKTSYRTAQAKKINTWLKNHMKYNLFTISW